MIPASFPAHSLILIAGLPGSGKTRLAHWHFGRSEVLCPDRCRWLLGDDEEAHEADADADALLLWLTDRRLRLGKRMVIAGGTLDPSRRATYRALAAQHNAPCYLVLVDVPLEQAIRQAAGRARYLPADVVKQCLPAYVETQQRAPGEGYADWWVVSGTESISDG